jgi:2-C-methyl-D-erythritol 2,4-cyclodiphosphate synthase
VGEGESVARVGLGYDIHRLVTGRPLVLAGVTLPWDLGLEGHSDGDVICHVVADALLGAAGLGDIGQYFPSDDEKWRGASSIKLLGGLGTMLEQGGFTVHNIDVTVILEVPRMGPYRTEMIANLAEAAGLPAAQVGLKAKGNDGLGPVGAGEAIAAIAVALVEHRA